MWDQFQQWGVGAGLFVLGVVATVAKSWLGAKLKAFAEFLYSRLAGSRLLRRTALARYIRAVHDRHDKFAVSFQADDDLKLPMESVYVPLRFAAPSGATAGAAGVSGGGRRPGEPAATLRQGRHSVVLGVPGAGKTMLLRHEILVWARQRLRPARRHGKHPRVDLSDIGDLPVLLELHRLNNNPGWTLEEHVVDHFKRHNFPSAHNWVRRALREGHLTLYFDGLDEVTSAHRDAAVDKIREFAQVHASCRIVVTCRVAVYEAQFAEQFHQTLRVEDFDEHLIRRFLGGWPWPEGTATETVEQLMAALRDTPQLMPLARNPLLLTMIAYLYSYVYAGTDQVLPHTRADFYKQVVDNLLIDQRRRPTFAHPLKKAVLHHLALAAQDTPAANHDRLALPEEGVLETVRSVLEAKGRPAELDKDVLKEIVDRSGLLLAVDNGERYQFAHLTLQEYLAAGLLAGDPVGLLRRYRKDPHTWRETVRLWCGVEERDCTEVIRTVYAQDPLLAFQCLADAHMVDDTLADEIIEHFRDRLGSESSSDQAVIAAFGLVAADRRPRGVQVFDFLRQTAHSDDRYRATAACHALAATHLPRAADVLAGGIPWDAAGPAITAMGDIAVPVLSRLAAQGQPQALEALWAIRTPRAALALNALLWVEPSSQTTSLCAAYLGELLSVPEIEAELRTAPVPSAPGNCLTWVWRPFSHGPGDALVAIAGRIAAVFVRDPALPLPLPEPPPPDPRIMAALSLVQYSGDGGPREILTHAPRIGKDLVRELQRVLVARGSLRYVFTQDSDSVYRRQLAHHLEATCLRPGSGLMDSHDQDALLAITLAMLREAGLSEPRIRFLNALPRKLRLRAVVCLALAEFADQRSWDTLPERPLNTAYRYVRSWHYRLIVLLCIAASGIAVWGAMGHTTNSWTWANLLPEAAVAQIVLGWSYLLRNGVVRETGLWVNRGLLSPRTITRGGGSLWNFRTYGLLVCVPAYFLDTAAGRWGLLAAAGIAVATTAACTALHLRACRIERDVRLRTHPVRRLVLPELH
ncbi:NACHT domain-containing protein [Streptomyces sp. URMC 124]|uniref:NACHT domain-containing protein n=1 Tax=Streptomyces sp. URMC 124 TaxID=3423405 RepID=UPI003F1CF4DE